MRLRFWLGFAAVVAIAIGSIAGALVVRSNDRANFKRRQQDEAVRSARQAQAVAALSVGQLTSAAAFYRAEGAFSQREFEILASSLLREGALSGTSFIANVPLSERTQYERIHGFPIVEGTGDRKRTAGIRPQYFPVTYAASKLKVTPAFGYDLEVDPDRGPILRRARDSGRAAATPIVPLLLSGGHGLIVYQPVYRAGAPIATVAERRAALLGFAGGGFRASDLAAAALSAVPDDVSLQLRQNGRMVIGTPGALSDAASAPVHVADRTWLLILRDPDRPDVSLPILMAVVGISLAGLLGVLIWVWSHNERMQELQRQASQDSLTGLKNRRRFEEDLRTEMARSQREEARGALLMLDLDNFKAVNDSLGHQAGDRVIEEIAGVLRGRMRKTDVLARLGGDEFGIVLPRCDEAEAQSVAEAIAMAVREHVPERDGVSRITASIGIAMFGEDPRMSLETVVSEADAAMYAAKDAGRDAIRVFDPLAVQEATSREDRPEASV